MRGSCRSSARCSWCSRSVPRSTRSRGIKPIFDAVIDARTPWLEWLARRVSFLGSTRDRHRGRGDRRAARVASLPSPRAGHRRDRRRRVPSSSSGSRSSSAASVRSATDSFAGPDRRFRVVTRSRPRRVGGSCRSSPRSTRSAARCGGAIAIGVWVIAVLVAASRVVLGVHWPTDVVASLLLAVIGVAAAERFVEATHSFGRRDGKGPDEADPSFNRVFAPTSASRMTSSWNSSITQSSRQPRNCRRLVSSIDGVSTARKRPSPCGLDRADRGRSSLRGGRRAPAPAPSRRGSDRLRRSCCARRPPARSASRARSARASTTWRRATRSPRTTPIASPTTTSTSRSAGGQIP